MSKDILPQPEPKAQTAEEAARQRHTELMRRNPPTAAEVDELVTLQKRLLAGYCWIGREGRA